MVQFNKNYNAERSEPENGTYGLINEGEHKMIVEGSELKNSKKGDDYLNFTIRIIDGQFANRLLWVVAMTSGEYEESGAKKIKNIAYATGVKSPKDSADFNGIPFFGVVKHIKDKLSGELKAHLVDFKPCGNAKIETKSAPRPAPIQTKTAPVSAPAENLTDDDIPF